VNATTIRTTIRPTFGRTILAAMALALLAALLAAQAAGAAPNGGLNQKKQQQRAADFADGCKSAGGTPEVVPSTTHNATLVECDFGDYAVGCVFQDFPYESIDVCADSRGLTAPPTGTHGDLGGSTELDPTGPGTGQGGPVGGSGGQLDPDQGEATPVATTVHAGTRAAPTGGRVVLVDDDDQP
jgi:hypothetical protein